jgi:signal transduction histidine kinase
MAVGLSEFIRRHRERIVAAWSAKVREEVLRTALSQEQLRDALLLFLDEVIEALGHSGAALAQSGHSAVARAHGRQRHTLRHHISEVVREYGLLFECIVTLAREADTQLEPEQWLELSRCLYAGAAEAVDEFAEKSRTERRHADFEAFAFLAHEIRNPLSTARLSWELLSGSGTAVGPGAERLGRSLERLGELVDYALTHSRLEMIGEGAPLHRERLSLAQLLRDAAEDCAAQAEHKGIELQIEAPLGAELSADARLLRSALSNLVRNAVKFTHRGGKIQLRGRLEQGSALFEIEDQCGGLPPERSERLFESFIQAGPERSGFGLGLAIVRQAVEAHRGTVEVRSRPGSGCVFALELPPEVEL